jgi:hypothetical protein
MLPVIPGGGDFVSGEVYKLKNEINVLKLRVWLVTPRLRPGKSLTFFTVCRHIVLFM